MYLYNILLNLTGIPERYQDKIIIKSGRENPKQSEKRDDLCNLIQKPP